MTWKGLHPVAELSRQVDDKGISLSKVAMKEIEARLERNPEFPTWDILIQPAGSRDGQDSGSDRKGAWRQAECFGQPQIEKRSSLPPSRFVLRRTCEHSPAARHNAGLYGLSARVLRWQPTVLMASTPWNASLA